MRIICMELRYFTPRPDIRRYVRAYYYYATPAPAIQPLCAELGNIRILLDGAGRLRLPGGGRADIKAAFLIGPTMGAYTMDAAGPTEVFGVGISPHGWGAMLGVNADEAADRVFSLTDFGGAVADAFVEDIGNASNNAERVRIADRFFARLLGRRADKTLRYPHALDRWLLDPNDLKLDQLIETMDLSRRQTDRLAKQFFGASPKLLQRKYRALRAADRIRAGLTDWFAAAGSAYYDQSHFIKEFKTFMGVTPHQFATNQAELISRIQRLRRAPAIRLPLASL